MMTSAQDVEEKISVCLENLRDLKQARTAVEKRNSGWREVFPLVCLMATQKSRGWTTGL